MKREISPGVMVVAIVVLLGIAVFAFLYLNKVGPFGGAKPTLQEQIQAEGTNNLE